MKIAQSFYFKGLMLNPQGGNSPLFSSWLDLGNAVVALDPNGNPRSTASFVSQFSSGMRSLPKGLSSLLLAAVTIRLEEHAWDESEAAQLLVLLQRALTCWIPPGVTPAHARALAAIDNPVPEMLSLLRSAEIALGFPLREETCLALLKDHALHYAPLFP